MPGSTITTTLSHGVSLGFAAYASPLTITSACEVDPTSIAAGKTAVINDGTILSQNGAGLAGLPVSRRKRA